MSWRPPFQESTRQGTITTTALAQFDYLPIAQAMVTRMRRAHCAGYPPLTYVAWLIPAHGRLVIANSRALEARSILHERPEWVIGTFGLDVDNPLPEPDLQLQIVKQLMDAAAEWRHANPDRVQAFERHGK